MLRNLGVSIFVAIVLISSPILSQEESEPKIELSKKTFGINFGTGYFQNIVMNLKNIKQEILTTSNNLTPMNIKANFNYYFTPSLAFRFSSGYGFLKQKSQNEIDFGRIDSMDVKLKDVSNFSVTGFPAEIALIFRTPIDARANMFLHFGIGLGYYGYNYKTEGIYKEFISKTDSLTWEENYVNPEMTLSGGAQFFVLGFDINLSPKVTATLEVSKVGWSMMKLTGDIVKQYMDAGKITYEIKYGYYQKDYAVKNGFDDIAVSLGLFWQL